MKFFALLMCYSLASGAVIVREEETLGLILGGLALAGAAASGSGSGSGGASAGAGTGFATTGNAALDMSQTLGLAYSLAALDGSTNLGDSYTQMTSLIQANPIAANALASIMDRTASNVHQLAQFLTAFKAQPVQAGDQLWAVVTNIIIADIEFKKALISCLVNTVSSTFSTATETLAASVASASAGIQSTLRQNIGQASGTTKGQMATVLQGLKQSNAQLTSGIAAALGNVVAWKVATAQNLLQAMGTQMSSGLQGATQASATFLSKIGAGLSALRKRMTLN